MPRKPRDPDYKYVARYKSRSGKKKGDTEWHYVTMDRKGSGKLRCTCKGYGFTGKCWHTDRCLDRIVDKGYRL